MDRTALSAAMPLDLESLTSEERMQATTTYIEKILSAIEQDGREPTDDEFDALATAISRLGVRDFHWAVSVATMAFAPSFGKDRKKVKRTPIEPGERTLKKLRELLAGWLKMPATPLMEVFEYMARLDNQVRLNTARVSALQQVLISVVLTLPRSVKDDFRLQLRGMAQMAADQQDELGAAATAIFDETFAGFTSLVQDDEADDDDSDD